MGGGQCARGISRDAERGREGGERGRGSKVRGSQGSFLQCRSWLAATQSVCMYVREGKEGEGDGERSVCVRISVSACDRFDRAV